ncbi:hypothetical protein ABZ470_28625 [Streptosporangium sp. NPDC020072]|uniref:hypothetical protein n=1 Tax=Streptosporangium sp. NPDC020072 TaxID=3154788 RepID=UPI003430BC45
MAAGSLVVLTSSQSVADTDTYISDFFCTPSNDLAPAQAKVLVRVAFPTKVYIGQSLDIKWTLGDSPFKAPEDSPAKARVVARGSAGISDYWSGTGTLDSMGETVVANALQKGAPLPLPTLAPGSYIVGKEGEIKVTPRSLTVQYLPSDEVTVFNDSVNGAENPAIKYSVGNKWIRRADDKIDDIGKDVHATTDDGATAEFSFTGTGVEYVTERDDDMGEVEVTLTEAGSPVQPATKVNASKEADGQTNVPADAKRTQQVLWSVKGLKYGTYTVKLKNASPGKYLIVDAFRVLKEPKPELYTDVDNFNAVCKPTKAETVPVKVEKSPTPTPTATTPTPTPTRTPSVVPSTYYTTVPPHTATPKPTLTVTATVTPTRPTPTAPQVIVTPSGGAQTGEAPDENRSGAGLIGGGTAMVLASVVGGVALRRRRAAHSQGR